MANFISKSLGKKSPLRLILLPLLSLVILAVLSSVVLRSAFARIQSLRGELENAQRDENVLKEKEIILKEVQQSIAGQAQVVALALPSENPALIVISQVKNLAFERALFPQNLEVGAETQEAELMSVPISFDMEGDLTEVLDFVKSLTSISPLSTIDKLAIDHSAGVSHA